MTDSHDDAERPDPVLVRPYVKPVPAHGLRHELAAVNLTPEIWNAAAENRPISETSQAAATLLLDARMMSHHVGASITLASTALEVRIESALNILAAQQQYDPGLWTWINERKDFRTRPSNEEQWDVLLKILCGRSLKTESRLWEGFKSLKSARNSFVHGGVPLIGKTPVDDSKAFELIGLAHEIVTWIESLLPEDERLPEHIEVLGFRHTMTI